jgi:hypothetical protein
MNILQTIGEALKTTDEVDNETKAIIGLFSETNVGPENTKSSTKGKDIFTAFLERRDRKILAH